MELRPPEPVPDLTPYDPTALEAAADCLRTGTMVSVRDHPIGLIQRWAVYVCSFQPLCAAGSSAPLEFESYGEAGEPALRVQDWLTVLSPQGPTPCGASCRPRDARLRKPVNEWQRSAMACISSRPR
jgi:hypothetical protein